MIELVEKRLEVQKTLWQWMMKIHGSFFLRMMLMIIVMTVQWQWLSWAKKGGGSENHGFPLFPLLLLDLFALTMYTSLFLLCPIAITMYTSTSLFAMWVRTSPLQCYTLHWDCSVHFAVCTLKRDYSGHCKQFCKRIAMCKLRCIVM